MPPDAGVVAFVRAALPPAPARVLEVGAGGGKLAAALAVEAAEASFDAAVAVVSLHHVEPLVASCERLAEVVRPGGRIVIDEFDIDRFDERAARWQAAQHAAAGLHVHGEPESWVADLREHLHPLGDIRAALAPAFAIGEPVRGAYLYRWDLDPALRAVEERLVAEGALPATGARLVGV